MTLRFNIFSLCLSASLLSCGGGGGNKTFSNFQESSNLASTFKGLTSIEKNPDLSWTLRWELVDASDFQYAVFKDNEQKTFDYNSPLLITSFDTYRYKPKNIFTDGVACFIVRVSNYTSDVNEAKLCTTDEPLTFLGIEKIERNGDGGYLASWTRIPVDGVIYAIYEKKNDDLFNFEQPSYDAIKENFFNIPVGPRGESTCFNVRYTHPDLPIDENTAMQCPAVEPPLEFPGIKTVTALSSTSVKIEWQVSSSKEVVGYKIYQGSDFKEEIGSVAANINSFEIVSLVSGRQYNFGVRAIDEFDREDSNLIIRPIKMPTE